MCRLDGFKLDLHYDNDNIVDDGSLFVSELQDWIGGG